MTAALASLCAREALFAYAIAHFTEPSSYCQFPRSA